MRDVTITKGQGGWLLANENGLILATVKKLADSYEVKFLEGKYRKGTESYYLTLDQAQAAVKHLYIMGGIA